MNAAASSADRGRARHRVALGPLALLAFPLVCLSPIVSLQGRLFDPAQTTLVAPDTVSPTDAIVVADVADRTAGARWSRALRQALRTALDESPHLNLLPDAGIAAALERLGHGQETPLTPDVAAEVCRQTGARAYIVGSLSAVAGPAAFDVDVTTVKCVTGTTLARERAGAASESKVVDAIGTAATKLRRDLGETSDSVSAFSTPLSQATTASLEAMNSWALGVDTLRQKGAAAAVPLLASAIERDNSFTAAAYELGIAYRNAGNEARARDLFSAAFAHRERATTRRRMAIASQYYSFVTVDAGRAIESFKEWMRSYPNDDKAVSNLGSFYGDICLYKDAIAQFERARRMNPTNYVYHENLMEMLLAIGDFDGVHAAYEEMQRNGLDDDSPHLYLYAIGVIRNSPREMATEAAWFEGKADLEHEMLSEQADGEAYVGRLTRARALTDRAVEAALRANNTEQAAGWLLNSAWREALFGNAPLAHDRAVRALAIAPDSREGAATAAIVLARTGDVAGAERAAVDIRKRYPDHAVMQSYWLPCIRAQIALQRHDAASALTELRTAAPLDTLFPQVFYYSHMPSVVLRAEAYALAGQLARAAREWETVVANPGIAQLSATAPIARLQIARLYKALGESEPAMRGKARTAYEAFASLWRGADADVPIWREARREIAALP